MGIVTEYLKYQQDYQEKYGERTLVLYQVGSFYEIYTYDPDKDESPPAWPSQKLGHATDLSDLLGYTLTRKNKNKPYSIDNPNMIGFPCIAYEKHKDILLTKNYTIVIVDQDKSGKNANRAVSKILSPATSIDDLTKVPITNQIVSIYIEIQKEHPKFEDYLIIIGVSSIDVTTGSNTVGEIYSKEKDGFHGLQEVYRFLKSAQPRELIINITRLNKELTEKYKNYVSIVLDLDSYPISTFITNNVNPEYLKSNYHETLLTKIFKSNMDRDKIIIEELGLERFYYGTISYVLLLQYCYEHNDQLIERIKKPDTHWLDESQHLILTHNASRQLNLLPIKSRKKTIDSLFSVINHTSTSMGHRFLQDMLCNPLTRVDDINRYYSMISDMIEIKLIEPMDEHLKKIPDLERYQRKLQLKIIKPNELANLFRGYIEIVNIYSKIVSLDTNLKELLFVQVNEFNQCLSLVLSKYDLNKLTQAVINGNEIVGDIFHKNVDSEADNFISIINRSVNNIEFIVDHLNTFLAKSRGRLISYDQNGKELGLLTTVYKAKVLSQSDVNTEITGKINFVTINKDVMITSDKIASLISNVIKNTSEYSKYLYRHYTQIISNIADYSFFNDLIVFISKLDYVKSNAKSAVKNNYYRPTIIPSETSKVDIKDLRHPIAEKLIDSQYITNDISFDRTGMLLYGANSTGKSTLAKAIGLNIIMAQCGMFVPSHLTYSPYNKIITRLSGEDDLIAGKSSFVVEMSELRTILRHSDSRTLVLADELCRGTTTQDGTAITISTIKELVNRGSSFVISSHMHHLATNPHISSLGDKLKISHLSLYYDESADELIYDRKIKEGSGDAIYGLEVAKSLSIDKQFISDAISIRREIMDIDNELLPSRKSRYNNRVYMNTCSICGKNKSGLVTHHIEEQNKADDNGFIDHFHKNSSFNLLVLCDDCHKNLHSNGLKVITQQTPKGNIISVNI